MAKKFVCTKDYPVVETKQGKLRGFLHDKIFKFYGIKYADAKRWQMPEPPAKWEGIKDALGYGYVSPMLSQDVPGSGELKVPHRYWPMDENCQYLNIWTPAINDGKKRAVMFWLHGGGFFAGSSIEQIAYDGTSMAETADVVVVTINHRLNILGYMDLSAFGEEYANSGNVGNADMVAALQWVHDNIEGFGGDPDNVTIFGQSGGGMKVCSLMNTEAANGLFAKAIMMSGVGENEPDSAKVNGKAFAEKLMEKCGVKTVKELAALPYSVLADAYNAINVRGLGAPEDEYHAGSGPIANEWYHGNPLLHGWTEHGKTIPLMIGSVLDEFKAFAPGRADRDTMTEAEAKAMVAEEYGDKADEVIKLFKAAYPGKNLIDLMQMDTMFRPCGIKLIKSRMEECTAKTYSYIFAPTFSVDCGSGAWHCSDIPYAFHNMDITPYCNFEGSDELQDRYFNAYINFAKYGDPSNEYLPEWPECKPGDESVMIFDKECEVRHNFDYELIDFVLKYGTPFSFAKTKIEH